MSVLSKLCQEVMNNLRGCLLLLTRISFLEKQKYTRIMIQEKCGMNVIYASLICADEMKLSK